MIFDMDSYTTNWQNQYHKMTNVNWAELFQFGSDCKKLNSENWRITAHNEPHIEHYLIGKNKIVFPGISV